MVDFNRFYPGVLLGFFHDFVGDVADGLVGKVVLQNLDLCRRLFENDGGNGNFAGLFAVHDVSAGGVTEPRHLGENSFQCFPNGSQFSGVQLFGMDLETYGGRAVFFAPVAKLG